MLVFALVSIELCCGNFDGLEGPGLLHGQIPSFRIWQTRRILRPGVPETPKPHVSRSKDSYHTVTTHLPHSYHTVTTQLPHSYHTVTTGKTQGFVNCT